MPLHQQTLHRLLHRPEQANKYDFGHLLIIGGSPGMIGAPLLAAMAAMRTGAGLVTIAAPADAIHQLEERVLEVMTLQLPDGAAGLEAVNGYIKAKKVTALVAGPGLRPTIAVQMPHWLPKLDLPVLLDATAATSFHDRLQILTSAGQPNPGIILTPHDGEYQKLTGEALPTDNPERTQAAIHFARDHHVTLVCKGHHSIVAHADGSAYQEQRGNPGLAKAGTGDVLSGMIGGLLAQGVAATEAADLGVHLHAIAGDLAAAAKTQASILASDIPNFIPQALRATSEE